MAGLLARLMHQGMTHACCPSHTEGVCCALMMSYFSPGVPPAWYTSSSTLLMLRLRRFSLRMKESPLRMNNDPCVYKYQPRVQKTPPYNGGP